MSYAHQTKKGTGVNSYSPRVSGVPDPTFDDWFHLRPDFSRATIHIGNMRGLGLGVGGMLAPGSVIGSENIPEQEMTLDEHIQANGPLDLDAPVIDIISPAAFTTILQGSNLTVTVTATDDVSPTSVIVRFDVDGSGAIDATGETQIATPIGSDQYEATFLSLAGPASSRGIAASVSDDAGHMAQDTQPVFVPEPSVAMALAAGAVLLRLLQKRRAAARES
jgi:hypothetical protein